MIRQVTKFARYSTKSQSSTSLLLPTLLRKVAAHYEHSGDSPFASLDLARQELKWIEEGAKEKAGRTGAAWEDLLSNMVDQLVDEHKPLPYILGNQPFHPLPVPLLVRPPTLIPRPETEHWLSHLSSLFLSISSPSSAKRPLRMLDIGTGTGCIPLSLAYSLSSHYRIRAIGVDQSSQAVSLARENTARCQLEACVKIIQADLFEDTFAKRVKRGLGHEGLEGFDLVVSNPPYITRADFANLPPSVKAWEDRRALVGERVGQDSIDDGLIFYDKILSILSSVLDNKLKTSGSRLPVLAFEVGSGQAQEVAKRIRETGLGLGSDVVKDQWGIERLVLGYRL